MTLELRKAPKGGTLHPPGERANRIIAGVPARVEPPFRGIKRRFGHGKTRHPGPAKTRPQIFPRFARGTLFEVRRRLLA